MKLSNHLLQVTRLAAQKAQRMGVAVHTLQLGSDRKGKDILSQMARITGGSSPLIIRPVASSARLS